MATTYFDLFKKGSARNQPAQPTDTSRPYGSTSGYQSTPGIQGPAQYQTAPQPYYQPYQPQTSSAQLSPKLQQKINEQRSRMGNSAYLHPGDRLMRARDIPWVQTNLELENQQKSELDRQKAYEELMRSWYGLGQSEESLAAKSAAMGAVESGGPWTSQLLDQGRGAIKNTGSVALQGAQRTMAEELARRGMGGSSIMGLNQAKLGQEAALGIQQQLAQFEQQATLQNEAAQQIAREQLGGLASDEQAQRTALDQAIASLYSNTQREPLDTSTWAEFIKKGKKVL